MHNENINITKLFDLNMARNLNKSAIKLQSSLVINEGAE